jgi:hypothetical protein
LTPLAAVVIKVLPLLIADFLNEFYAHRKNQSIHTILLSSSDIDIQLRSLLHTPLWKQRVFYIHGSALRNSDLGRAKVAQARAVFIIPSRGIDKDMADQHTILRSWAIKVRIYELRDEDFMFFVFFILKLFSVVIKLPE